MKRESRILLHVRTRSHDFIAVVRGVGGIEHLRILRIREDVKKLVREIAREGFFHEVKYVVTYPQDLGGAWLEAVRSLGRSNIKTNPKIPNDMEKILESYANTLSNFSLTLNSMLDLYDKPSRSSNIRDLS